MADVQSAASEDVAPEEDSGMSERNHEAKLRKARRSALRKLSRCVGQEGLFESVMLVLADHRGRVQTFSNSPGWRRYLGSEKHLAKLLDRRKPKLKHLERLAKIAIYGDPPTPQHAFEVLNANGCENLLRVMEFSKLKKKEVPQHLQELHGSYIHLGKFLDEAHRGKVNGNKFEGHDKQNGRFKAQVFQEHQLCRLDSWTHGECPGGPEYITFEDLLKTPIAKMTKPMKVAAIFLMLEWANPGKLHTHTQGIIQQHTQCICNCMHAL